MIDLISAGAGALVGFIVSALIGYMIWLRQKQIEGAIKLLEEYHSPSMFQSRGAAWSLLGKHPDAALSQIGERDELSDVSVVLHFFERVGVLGKHKLIDKRLARQLLGGEYDYWNKRYFISLRNKESADSTWAELFRTLHHASLWLSPALVVSRGGKNA